jgi:hypothetical protein
MAAIPFSGHENSGNLAYVTRINLDVADPDQNNLYEVFPRD